MSIRIFLFVVMVVIGFGAFGRSPVTVAESGKCLLWRVSGNGLTHPSYLFAMMDYVCPTDYLWPETAEKYYKESGKICLQANPADSADKAKSARAFLNTGGKTLKYYFAPGDYAKVERYAKDELRINLDRVQQYQPMVLRSFIVKKLLGCSDPLTYVERIAAMALSDGKQLSGLETIGDELATLQQVRYNEKVAQILVQMANGSKTFENYRKKVEDAFQQQDLPAIYSASKEATVFTPAELTILYDKTSQKLAEKMPPLMKHGQVFFVINAVHFWGDAGVISSLKKKGYKVEPVLQ